MKFDDLINGIERTRESRLSEHELISLKKCWNACVDCIADEWPVLGDPIRQLKQSYNKPIQPTG